MTLELILFNIFVFFLIILDLYVFKKKSNEVNVKLALGWSFFWVLLSLGFNVLVYYWKGQDRALEFFTAYLIEKSLSVDNLFFFLIIFSFFKIPHRYQHKVLLWGVLGALFMRALFILVGISLIQNFHFLFYILGAFLLITSIKILFRSNEDDNPEKNFIYKFLKRIIPITTELHQEKFIIKEPLSSIEKKTNKRTHRWVATPLLVVLIMIELTDVIFALDSIPAVLAITQDPFIAYTSNIFAVLGLRALYFAIAHLLPKFKYLHSAIAIILGFIGLKMLCKDFYEIPTLVSLFIIISIVTLSIIASLIHANISQNHKQ
jgi:tellurite resistance protein TerC